MLSVGAVGVAQLCGRTSASASGALIRSYHLSATLQEGQVWRKQKGLPANPNAYGVLTDGPDYSFVDGRPTPPGMGRIRRAEKQYKIAQKIMQLTKEVDFAVDHRKQKDQEEADRKKAYLDRKLKPKGKEFSE